MLTSARRPRPAVEEHMTALVGDVPMTEVAWMIECAGEFPSRSDLPEAMLHTLRIEVAGCVGSTRAWARLQRRCASAAPFDLRLQTDDGIVLTGPAICMAFLVKDTRVQLKCNSAGAWSVQQDGRTP
jgi:hypothetical protein